MTSGSGARMSWWDVPPDIRGRVEEILGSSVMEARSQSGGFSPGSADRVLTEAGHRAFVKTASLAVNPDAPGIHRAEAAITARLPAWVPAPRFIGAVDEPEWVALVLEDIEGRHPATPWTADELEAVLDALHGMTTIAPPPELPATDAAAELGWLGQRWNTLASGTGALPTMPDGLDRWANSHLREFQEAASLAPADVVGDRLVHLDVRADNLLIRPNGQVVLVDWPWAARGVGWLDALALLINVRYFDPTFDVEDLIARHAVFADMTPEAATRVLIALAGFFTEASTRAPVPGIPTLRIFQRDQAIATLAWLRERLGS